MRKSLTQFCWNIEVWAVQKHVNLVDLVKSFPTIVFLQNLALVQLLKGPWKVCPLSAYWSPRYSGGKTSILRRWRRRSRVSSSSSRRWRCLISAMLSLAWAKSWKSGWSSGIVFEEGWYVGMFRKFVLVCIEAYHCNQSRSKSHFAAFFEDLQVLYNSAPLQIEQSPVNCRTCFGILQNVVLCLFVFRKRATSCHNFDKQFAITHPYPCRRGVLLAGRRAPRRGWLRSPGVPPLVSDATRPVTVWHDGRSTTSRQNSD